jgi:FkbM family methyltransferase
VRSSSFIIVDDDSSGQKKMLLRRLVTSLFRQRAPDARAIRVDSTAAERVEDLPGFNKLVRARHGLFIANENDVYIGRALIEYGEFCELEWRLLQRYCHAGDVVVEVGANIGGHTVNLARTVGPHGRVLAIEPQPVIFQSLCANLALNCLLNVDALNCGCAESRRTLALPLVDYASEGNFGGIALREQGAASASIPVVLQPLDDLVGGYPRIDLIKIDVEGMEQQVLAGASHAIERFKPVLYVENDRLKKSKALIDAIHGMGYRAWWHIPPLFNPDNCYGRSENLYPNICSFNMLCLHADAAADAPPELEEIVDATRHPLAVDA